MMMMMTAMIMIVSVRAYTNLLFYIFFSMCAEDVTYIAFPREKTRKKLLSRRKPTGSNKKKKILHTAFLCRKQAISWFGQPPSSYFRTLSTYCNERK